MSQLLETLCYTEGTLRHLELHQARLDGACDALGYSSFSLQDVIAPHLPDLSYEKLKVRVQYGDESPIVEVSEYHRLSNSSLKMVFDDEISYEHKFADRNAINKLFAQRDGCDNILIVKKGFLTDTAYTNIVLYDGTDWVTPSTPLLKGTMRQALLEAGNIIERDVSVKDLDRYEKICVVNAMISLDDMVEVEELH